MIQLRSESRYELGRCLTHFDPNNKGKSIVCGEGTSILVCHITLVNVFVHFLLMSVPLHVILNHHLSCCSIKPFVSIKLGSQRHPRYEAWRSRIIYLLKKIIEFGLISAHLPNEKFILGRVRSLDV